MELRSRAAGVMAVSLVALLAFPAYLIIGMLTAPIGIGMLMLMTSSPPILYLYPLVFAATWKYGAPDYYLDPLASVPLTALQWLLIGWVYGGRADGRRFSALLGGAIVLALVAGACAWGVLQVAGITLLVQGART